jgi:hypothetical protein
MINVTDEERRMPMTISIANMFFVTVQSTLFSDDAIKIVKAIDLVTIWVYLTIFNHYSSLYSNKKIQSIMAN